MKMLETLPEPEIEISDKELAAEVPLAVRNEAQRILIEKSGLDVTVWIGENSARFRHMLKTDAALRRLIVENIDEAVSEVEARLKEFGEDEAA